MRNVFYHKCQWCDWREYYFTNIKHTENTACKRIVAHEKEVHMKAISNKEVK